MLNPRQSVQLGKTDFYMLIGIFYFVYNEQVMLTATNLRSFTSKRISDKNSQSSVNKSGIPPTIGFPGGSDGKESTCNVGDPGSISGSGRSPGEGNGYPLQYSCLENAMDRGAWWATIHGLTQGQT